MQWLDILLLLIDLINGYRNAYSRSNNCLEFFEIVFKENMHYTCIAWITIDSVIRMDKKNHPQVYLGECKYKVKKIQMSRFISAKLESGSESDSETESKSDSDTELMAKLKSDCNFEWIILFSIFVF